MRFIPQGTLYSLHNVPSRPLEFSAKISFKTTGNQGAALATEPQTLKEDCQGEPTFESYTKRHFKSWKAFMMEKFGKEEPVLVTGYDVTGKFAMIAYSESGTSHEVKATIELPMFGSASAGHWGTWRTQHSPHTNHGPRSRYPPPPGRAIDSPSSHLAGTSETQSELNQCVFIRYFTMRRKFGVIPDVFRAGAGPHDLGSGDNTGDTFPELLAQSDAEPTMGDDDDPGEEREDADHWPDVVVRNTPHVWCLPRASFPL